MTEVHGHGPCPRIAVEGVPKIMSAPHADTVPSIFQLMRHHGLAPKRSLGQNFLADEVHLRRIVEAAELTPTDTVIEVGPGLGSLTHHLASRAGRVIAVELDRRLIPILRERFAHRLQVAIVHGDILALELGELLRGRGAAAAAGAQGPEELPYKVVANLPYYITSAVLRHFLEARVRPTRMAVLVQWEVARRIVARPGEMSLLAVSVQFYARPRLVNRVPAGAFVPRPNVDSGILRLDIRPEPAVPDVDPARFFQVVRAGFSRKRKQLLNSLSAGLALSKEEAREVLEAAGIDPRRRPETLSIQEWGHLVRVLQARGILSTGR